VVSFILTSNILDEIGIRLGIRPRDKIAGEQNFKYMKLINSILKKNLNFILFKEEVISNLGIIEALFLKKKGDISYEHIKEMYILYFNLRSLDIPNLHESFKHDFSDFHQETALYNLMSPGEKNTKKQPDKIKTLLLHKLKEKERSIQSELNESYNKDSFEEAVHLKKIKASLEDRHKGKLVISGQLKDSIDYQNSLDDLLGYFLIGFSLLLFLIGFTITIETVFYPSLTGTLGYLILIMFAGSAFFIFLYRIFFKKDEL